MNPTMLRLGVFVLLLLTLGMAERLWPRHTQDPRRGSRWPINLGLGAIDTLCVRLLVPWLAVDAARWAEINQIGILHLLHVRSLQAALIAFAALDLVIYVQHRAMHRLGVLWRLHRVHHTDLALDVSAGVRFHPLEILLSVGVKIATVVLLGAPAAIVLTFEIVLSSFALVTHANIALSPTSDRLLRRIFVTPDMHRIHHSILREEHDTNFGFHVSWWDRLFGSYTPQPRESQTCMPLGLTAYRAEADQRLLALLRQPFGAL